MFWVTKFAKLGGSLKGAIKEFTKMNGRMPSSAELNKMETIIKNTQSNVIPFPSKRITASKTTPKDPIDQRWIDQQAWAAKKAAENKQGAYNFALKRAMEIDKRPLDMPEVLKRYETLSKYPDGRSYLIDEVHDIEKGWTLPNIGQRTRQDVVTKIKGFLEKKAEGGIARAPMGLGGLSKVYLHMYNLLRKNFPTLDKGLLKTVAQMDDFKAQQRVINDLQEHVKLKKEYLQNREIEMFDPKGKTKHAAGGLAGQLHLNQGGRARFDNGGLSRRKFLQLMGGLASIPILGKFFKLAKPAVKAMKAVETSNAVGMPKWFPSLVNKVMNEGKDVTKQYSTVERSVVKQVELPNSKTKVLVEQDLATGNTTVDVGLDKHGWVDGYHGQPVRLHLKKGEWIEPQVSKTGKVKKKAVKTKDEFGVEEAEFTGDAESVKYEESSFEKFGEHGSDFSEVEKYATGKVTKTKPSLKAERAHWEPDDYAKGGLAGVLRL